MPEAIVTRRLDELVPYARNSRTHSEAQVAKIASSIREFGWTVPILVDDEGTVVAGHGRLEAARLLKLERVPTISLGHLSDSQRRAYVLADNRLALDAGWDEELLRLELEDLRSVDFDLGIIGFSDEELNELLPKEEETRDADEDDTPELQDESVTVLGDIWLLGAHRVLCGNATSVENLRLVTDCQQVDMFLTDPPYNVGYVGKTEKKLKIQNDSMAKSDFRKFLVDAYMTADSVMKAGAVFYIWHADSEGYNFRGAANDMGWTVRQCLIWKKNSLVLGRQDYHWQHEPCLYGWKDGAGHLWASDRKQTTILEFDRPSRSAEHPTMKPVALFEYLMLNNTKGGDIVLDSFAGSGPTVIAAEKNGRKACAVELDPRYVDVIVKRWQQYSGKDAVLESNGSDRDIKYVGMTFNDIASKRTPD